MIGQTIANICRFSFFKDDGCPPSWILKVQTFG